jgi:hypothetical protein
MKHLTSLLLLVVLPACSENENTSKGAAETSALDCVPLCERLAEAQCKAEPTVDECVDECHAQMDDIRVHCGAKLANLTGCVESRAVVACDADGKGTAGGCEDETSALESCAACAPRSGDDDCDICIKTSCCSEGVAYSSDPSRGAFEACRTGCQDAECDATCDDQYPATAEKYHVLFACSFGSCAGVCGN